MSNRFRSEPEQYRFPIGKIVFWSTLGLIAFILLIAFFGLWYTTGERERGVLLRNGAVVGITEPGFGLKMPFVDSVNFISIGQQTSRFSAETYSFDQQVATIAVSFNWAVDPTKVEETYISFGNLENVESQLVQRRVPDVLKPVFGRYTATRAIQERAILNQEITTAILAAFEGTVVTPISVQVEDISFSTAYEQLMDQRSLAEGEVARLRQAANQASVNAEIQVINATATADASRATAEARADVTRLDALAAADSVRLAGEAEAAAILAKGTAEAEATRLLSEAVSANPTLVDLTAAQRWNGQLPTHMIPGSALPYIDLTPTGLGQ